MLNILPALCSLLESHRRNLTHRHRARRPGRRVYRPIVLPLFLLMLITAVAASVAAPGPAFSQTREQTIRALLATVQVIMPDDNLEDISLGSGTVMDQGGLILTNHHVVAGPATNGLMNESALALIAMTPDDLRGESVIRYFGTVVKIDPELDLALIQISALLDDAQGSLPADLGLTAIERGDSDELMIADTINIFGYPGIGGNTPTLTRGLVSGFLDEDRNGIYEWIKTDAVLSSGNSGGLATDDRGRFVGVPTAGRFSDASQLGLVRTGALALDFVDSYFPAASADQPAVSSVQFATALNRNNEPINPALHFAQGTTDLYAVFQHRNFSPDRPFAAIWRLDGAPLARDEFLWDGGANGSNWISINVADGMPDGFLQLELVFDNASVYRGGVTLGAGAATDPNQPSQPGAGAFGPITFAHGMAGSRPIDAAVTFTELQTVYAVFDYAGMAPGMSWNTRWYLNANQVLEQFELWDGGVTGVYYVTLTHPNGLPVGSYRLELYIQGQQVQSGEFQITGGETPGPHNVGVTGTLRDRDNQRRLVNGAMVIVLEPSVSIQSWLAAGMPANQVVAKGASNRQGVYRLDARLQAGTEYSLVVMHEQYRTVALDAHSIPGDASDPYRLDIDLQRN